MKTILNRSAMIPCRSFLLVPLLAVLLLLSSPPGCEASRLPHRYDVEQQNVDDHYTILGVSKNAASQEIKSTYYKLALHYHPDKVPDEEKEEAEQAFVKLNEAYSVLFDDKSGKSATSTARRDWMPLTMV
jgi:preprotein translocase subunit Sec63